MVKKLATKTVTPTNLSTVFFCGACKANIVGYYSRAERRIEHLATFCPACGRRVKWSEAKYNENY